MRKKARRILLTVAAISCVMFAWTYIQGASAGEAYDEVAELAFQEAQTAVQEPVQTEPASETEAAEVPAETVWIPEPIEDDPNVELLEQINLEALREVNPDVIGWIMIPDSKINYPLMQGTDNDYYLKHTWEKRNNAVGSIFMEHQNNPDLTDFNTIVYGHNMNNGSMFASLRKFSTESYRKARPYVYIVSDQGVYRYEIFSFYKAPVDSIAYGLSFQKENTKIEFLLESKRSSDAETGVIPAPTDRILTLSTCSGGGYTHRWVVQARLKMIQESA